jgi:hypothetical protein
MPMNTEIYLKYRSYFLYLSYDQLGAAGYEKTILKS